MIKKIITSLSLTLMIFASNLNAQNTSSMNFTPTITSDITILNHNEYLTNLKNNSSKRYNGYIFIESDNSFKFNDNISFDVNINLYPDAQFKTNKTINYQPYHNIANNERDFNLVNNAAIIEEIKIKFTNEDLELQLGKFNPQFGKIYDKNKRIGAYSWQFAQDYNLREKIGGQISALLENSKLSFSAFINDATQLSNSALNKRGAADDDQKIPGNSGSLSSYSINYEGHNPFKINNLFYQIGYRSMSASHENQKRENGYLIGAHYLYELNDNTKIIPLFEIVKIDNLLGKEKSDAIYKTASIQCKYSSWTTSATYNSRKLTQITESNITSNEDIFQLTIGYNITKNLAIDLTRAEIDNHNNKFNSLAANFIFNKKF
jgi:hypothetical protein